MASDEAGKAPGIKRELSVEDLFVPLNRLDVRHPSSSTRAADANPILSVSEDAASSGTSPNPKPRVPAFELARQQKSFKQPDAAPVPIPDLDHIRNPNPPATRLNLSFTLDMPPIPEETGIWFAENLGRQSHGFLMDCNTEEGGFGSGVALIKEPTRSKGSSLSKSTASVSDTGLQTQGNTSSDEDQQAVDNRKQRRMLSNRESARRSRLRKQQHLDELRGHVAQLRAQNSQMLNSFNLASQQFAQITEENRQLRAEAMDLSHKLQRLHHTVTSQRANNGLRHGADPRKTVHTPLY